MNARRPIRYRPHCPFPIEKRNPLRGGRARELEGKLFGMSSGTITHLDLFWVGNNCDVFEINGKRYKRRVLNPRKKAELEFTIDQYSKIKDDDIEEKLRLQLLTVQIALENFSEADFNDERLDSFMLDQVVAACLLIAKSFRQV